MKKIRLASKIATMIVCFAASIVFTSCKKDNNESSGHNTSNNTGRDVYYVSGDKTYKNGEVLYENGGNSIFVSGNDVYVVTDGKTWKNGQILYENGGRSIFVSGNDVYVVGVEHFFNEENADSYTIAKLWKNGAIQYLANANYAEARAGYDSGNDVYVVGREEYEDGEKHYNIGRLWKNGASQYFADAKYAEPWSVFVYGNDVFVTGANDVLGSRTWKNGKVLYENGGGCICVADSNVYVAGSERSGNYSIPTLWKNDVPQYLPTINSQFAHTSSVFVSGSDVYVAGSGGGKLVTIVVGSDDEYTKPHYYGTIWKNGIKLYASDSTSEIGGYNAVFVK